MMSGPPYLNMAQAIQGLLWEIYLAMLLARKNQVMLKSDLIIKLNQKYKSLSLSDTEKIIDLFFHKILNSLYEGHNIEIRGFGTFKKKVNKAKYVRNPKTNEKIYKQETHKIHFKIGRILHKRINEILLDTE